MAVFFRRIAILSFVFISIASSSCEKVVEQIQENVAYEIITNGRWGISRFDEGSTSLLSEYAPYDFQFYKGGVVIAYFNGNPDLNGTWLGKQETLAIESNFPGAVNPLKRLNGTWIISEASPNSVKSTRKEGSEVYTLWLKKI